MSVSFELFNSLPRFCFPEEIWGSLGLRSLSVHSWKRDWPHCPILAKSCASYKVDYQTPNWCSAFHETRCFKKAKLSTRFSLFGFCRLLQGTNQELFPWWKQSIHLSQLQKFEHQCLCHCADEILLWTRNRSKILFLIRRIEMFIWMLVWQNKVKKLLQILLCPRKWTFT